MAKDPPNPATSQRQAIRREMYEALEAARERERGKSLELILHEFRVGRTGVSAAHTRAPVRRARASAPDSDLASQLAYGRSFEKIPVAEPTEPAAAPKVVRFWVGDRRLGALKTVVVSEPPKRDRWGRIVR